MSRSRTDAGAPRAQSVAALAASLFIFALSVSIAVLGAHKDGIYADAGSVAIAKPAAHAGKTHPL
ncbi:MAG TPA: hypothetical protein VFH92_12950 [Phenylobacterium sp.]|nr:hypothetical protein [Phenylobacterium sp.]